MGHVPACASICVPEILKRYKNDNKYEFDFYVNPHNLCWYASDSWKTHNNNLPISFTVHIREFTLAEILDENK